nr:hypothetical protein [uncultured Microbacterium sp.]
MHEYADHLQERQTGESTSDANGGCDLHRGVRSDVDAAPHTQQLPLAHRCGDLMRGHPPVDQIGASQHLVGA